MLLRARTFREVSGRAPVILGESNVALASNGGTAFASSTTLEGGVGDYSPSLAINGDRTGAGWGSPGSGWNDATLGIFPDWLRVQFNGYKTINRVVVYTLQDNLSTPIEPTDSTTFSLYGVTDFQVQAWDGSAWVTVGTVTGNNLVKRTVSFSPVSTTDIRIYVTGGAGSYSRVIEVEAFGTAAAGTAPHGPDYVPPADPIDTTFTLKSPNSGTLPFRIGQTFAFNQALDTADIAVSNASAQVVAKSFYSNGSINFAEISGTYSSTANTATTCAVTAGVGATGTALTTAAITAAAPVCTVQCGGLGTVALSDYFGSPIKTYQAGHKSIQVMYATHVATTGLEVRWFVSHWAGSRQKIFWQVTNGPLDNGAGGQLSLSTRTFTLTVVAGGVTAFNASVTLYPHQDVNGEAWIGGDPQVTALADPVQLTASRMVGNYSAGGAPAEASLAGLQVTYTPGIANPHKAAMAGPGSADQIGLLPLWDSFYPCSGDARAWKASQIGARQIGAFAFNWRSYVTHRAPKPSLFSTWSFFGNHGASSVDCQADTNYWDFNHAPSVGYLPYLLTADAFYYERCIDNAALNYVARGEQDGAGVNRVMRHAARGLGWSMRSVGQAAAIAHSDDDVAQEYKTMLANQFSWLAARLRTNYQAAPLGISFIFNQEQANEISLTEGQIRTFMQFYLAQAIASIRDLHMFSASDDQDLVSDSHNHFIASLGGVSGDPAQFAFTHITAAYSMEVAATPTSGWFTEFGSVFANSPMQGTPLVYSLNDTVSNTLYGESSGTPAEAYDGYWGYYRCALAYAVDQGAPGAVEAWRRIHAADNASDLTSSRFDLKKTWAIEPRVDTALPAWRTAMSPLDVVTFSGTEPWSQPGFAPGSEATGYLAYSGGQVMRATSEFYMLGGGHGDSYRNEAWRFKLNQETPAWDRVTPSTPLDQVGYVASPTESGHTPYADGRAASRHTSWSLSTDETNRRVILHAAWALYGNGNGGALNVDALDIAVGDYVASDTYTRWPVAIGVVPSFAQGRNSEVYHPNQNGHLYKWNPSATATGAPGVITDLGDKGVSTTYEIGCGIDRTRNVLVQIGIVGQTSDNWYDLDASGAVHSLTLVGDAGAIADVRNNRHHVIYDEGADCMWIWRRVTSVALLYRLTITGTKPSLTFTISAASTLNGTIDAPDWFGDTGYGRFAEVPYLRGIVWVAGADKPVRFIATSNFP